MVTEIADRSVNAVLSSVGWDPRTGWTVAPRGARPLSSQVPPDPSAGGGPPVRGRTGGGGGGTGGGSTPGPGIPGWDIPGVTPTGPSDPNINPRMRVVPPTRRTRPPIVVPFRPTINPPPGPGIPGGPPGPPAPILFPGYAPGAVPFSGVNWPMWVYSGSAGTTPQQAPYGMTPSPDWRQVSAFESGPVVPNKDGLCPVGYYPSDDGKSCIKGDPPVGDPGGKNTCPPGWVFDKNQQKCVQSNATCPPGQHFDATKNACVADSPGNCGSGMHWDANAKKCVIDGPGSCPPGQTWDPSTGVCKTICPVGQHWDNDKGQCVPDSPAGLKPSGGATAPGTSTPGLSPAAAAGMVGTGASTAPGASPAAPGATGFATPTSPAAAPPKQTAGVSAPSSSGGTMPQPSPAMIAAGAKPPPSGSGYWYSPGQPPFYEPVLWDINTGKPVPNQSGANLGPGHAPLVLGPDGQYHLAPSVEPTGWGPLGITGPETPTFTVPTSTTPTGGGIGPPKPGAGPGPVGFRPSTAPGTGAGAMPGLAALGITPPPQASSGSSITPSFDQILQQILQSFGGGAPAFGQGGGGEAAPAGAFEGGGFYT